MSGSGASGKPAPEAPDLGPTPPDGGTAHNHGPAEDGVELDGRSATGWVPSARHAERQRSRRRAAARSVGLASASTAVVLVAAAVVIVHAPGWPRVRQTFFSGSDFRASFPDVLSGVWLNVRIFLVAEVAILVVGLLVAVLRSVRSPVLFPLRALAIVYTDVFRGVPTLLLIFLIGFGVPALQLRGVTDSPTLLGGAALVLSYGAYVAEVYRSGIESVHPSQRAAARSLGLRQGQTLRYVVLPQAVRRVVPPLLNDFVALQKDTALVAVLGPLDAVRQAQIYSSSNFNYTPYVAASLLFLALTIPMARFTDWLAARTVARRGGGGAP